MPGAIKGMLPDTVPFYHHGGFPADPGWSVAYPLIVSYVSEYYDDARIVEEHYAGVREFVESEIAQQAANASSNGLFWAAARYGDWCPPVAISNSTCHFVRPSISTFYFATAVETLARFAARLGNDADAARYAALAAATRAAFAAQLYNTSSRLVEDGLPVSQVIALALGGVVPAGDEAAVVAALVASLESGVGGRLAPGARPAGGIVFMRYAFEVLARGGRNDVALQMLLALGFPSVEAWLDAPGSGAAPGATTLWERWEETNEQTFGSKNHIMYGGFGKWLVARAGGLGRERSSSGWSRLVFMPPLAEGPPLNLTSAAYSIAAPSGLCSIEWAVAPGGSASVALRVPANALAALVLPLPGASARVDERLGPVWVSGAFVGGVPGVLGAAASGAGGEITVQLASGDFDFAVSAA